MKREVILHPVDELGALKAQISALKKRHDLIADELKAQGGVIEGDLFAATVIVAERESVDWKAVAAKLAPSRQLVQAHTAVAEVVTLKVTAKKVA